MRLSRLRLRLTAGFALAFALGLGLLAAAALGYLWRESNHRLDERLSAVADGVTRALARELHDTPDSSFAFAANEVVKEWPSNEDAFGIADAPGVLVAGVNRRRALDGVMGAWARRGDAGRFDVTLAGQDFRSVALPVTTFRDAGHEWRFAVVAFGSTEGLERDTEQLAGALAVAAPLIVLLSLVAGYAMARRALRPVSELRASIAAVAPSDLSRRLSVGEPPDEVGALAAEFNALLSRLEEVQRRNRAFVRETAHQIRTPLTLVLGEAGHELASGKSSAVRMRATLGRIRTAAEQMQRRVDELFLLAEAEAGARMRLDDDVELDGLALECTDLMRARATALGRALALGDVQPVTVRGNAHLLREALLELLENGCRHGSAQAPVTTEVRAEGAQAIVEVRSAGDRGAQAAENGRGLGVSIVSWIAAGHGGRFETDRRGDTHLARLVLPVAGRDALSS